MILKKTFLVVGCFTIFSTSLFSASQIIDNLEGTEHINLSRSDVNRLVFPTNIKFQANSKEKDLTISVVENEMYLKFTPYIEMEQSTVKDQVVDVGEKKIIYHKAKPAELFVVTEKKTYSLIVHPKKKDSTTVYFTESFEDKKQEIFKNKDSEYVANLANNIIKEILTKGKTRGFSKNDLNGQYSFVKLPEIKAEFAFKPQYVHNGYRYSVYEYELKNINSMTLSIPDVKEILKEINRSLNKKIKAYTIFYNNRIYKILPGKTAKLVIVVDSEV
jgi:hypothetical protein